MQLESVCIEVASSEWGKAEGKRAKESGAVAGRDLFVNSWRVVTSGTQEMSPHERGTFSL